MLPATCYVLHESVGEAGCTWAHGTSRGPCHHGGIQKPPELRRVIDGFRCKSIELLQLHFHIGAFDPCHAEDTGVYRSPQHVKAA